MTTAGRQAASTSSHGAQAAGLLLAAGGGRRLGGPKALVELDGERLVDRGVRLLRAGGCAPVVVVLGADAERARPSPADHVQVVVNTRWASGLASSLRAGLEALEGTAHAAVVALVDQPFVTAAAVQRVVAAWRGGAVAAVAAYHGVPSHPVLLDSSLWPAVKERATGDAGARVVLREQPWLVTSVACEDVADPADLDHPEDLAAARDPNARSPRCS